MNEENSNIQTFKFIKGAYGDFIVTSTDKKEVMFYRLSVLFCGLSFTGGMTQWFVDGSDFIWIWILIMSISIGLSLRWIHIYLRQLHRVLIIFWTIGIIGLLIIAYHFGLTNIINIIKHDSKFLFLIAPLFAALTGIGFKEFFCFRRIEAISLVIFIPLSLIGYLLNIFNDKLTFIMLFVSSFLLLILGINKFNLPAEFDIGDKSIFEFLENQRNISKIL